MLQEDLSVLNVIDSDFAMLNEELARYYGIEGVEGYEYRKVALKPAKAQLYRSKITYLGFEISAEGVEPIRARVEAISKIPPPKTLKQLRSFIQMVQVI